MSEFLRLSINGTDADGVFGIVPVSEANPIPFKLVLDDETIDRVAAAFARALAPAPLELSDEKVTAVVKSADSEVKATPQQASEAEPAVEPEPPVDGEKPAAKSAKKA